MHFSIDRTVHTTAFDKPVVDHWLERKIGMLKGCGIFKCSEKKKTHFRQAETITFESLLKCVFVNLQKITVLSEFNYIIDILKYPGFIVEGRFQLCFFCWSLFCC